MLFFKARGWSGHSFAAIGGCTCRASTKKRAVSPSSVVVDGGQYHQYDTIHNMRHSSRYCKRHSWLTQLGRLVVGLEPAHRSSRWLVLLYVGCTRVVLLFYTVLCITGGPEVENGEGPCGVKGRRGMTHDGSWMRSG